MPPAADSAFDLDRPAVREAIAQLEAAIGGRQSLIDAFVGAPPDPDADRLLGLIADPRNDKKPLSTLCAEVGLTAGELLRLYRNAATARAQVLAIHEVAAETPSVVRDVLRRAQNHYRLCTGCHGTGQVWQQPEDAEGDPGGDPIKVLHRPCDGTGQVLVDASTEHQKLALDLAGLSSKVGPLTHIEVDNSKSLTVVGALPFAQLQKAVQKVLDPPPPALPPAQPVEASEAEIPSVQEAGGGAS